MYSLLYFSSAALLSEQNQLAAPPLRKSSSAVDWSGVLTEPARKTSFQQVRWQIDIESVFMYTFWVAG